jgi:transcriptional regulator with XRE-family HTH domain
MSPGPRPALNEEAIREVREWLATPQKERRYTRMELAEKLNVSTNTIDRAAHGRGKYGKVQL